MRATERLTLTTRNLTQQEREEYQRKSQAEYEQLSLMRVSLRRLALTIAFLLLLSAACIACATLCWQGGSIIGTVMFAGLALLSGGLLSWLQIDGALRLKRISRARLAGWASLLQGGMVESIRCRPLGVVLVEDQDRSVCLQSFYNFYDVGEDVILCLGHACQPPNDDFELIRLPGTFPVIDVIMLGRVMQPTKVIATIVLPSMPDKPVFNSKEIDESPGIRATAFTFPGSLENLDADLRRFLSSKPRRGRNEYL